MEEGEGRLLGLWLRPGSLQSCRDPSNNADEATSAGLGEEGTPMTPELLT